VYEGNNLGIWIENASKRSYGLAGLVLPEEGVENMSHLRGYVSVGSIIFPSNNTPVINSLLSELELSIS